MSGYQRVTISIFDLGDEAAEVEQRLRPPELIAAIIAEFGAELPYLGQDPGAYQLLRDGAPLDDEGPLGAVEGARLVLAERPPPTPPQAQALGAPFYLREPESRRVFRVTWAPALIGRADPRLADEALLAVNLSGLPNSGRVSRRHARVVLQGSRPALECLAENPLVLRRGADEQPLVRGQPLALQAGDVLIFEFSQIQLQVIERTG